MTGQPPEIDRSRIRVKSFVLLPNAAHTHHAVWRGDDETKEPPSFHRLLGGSVEFGEWSFETAVREMREELAIELTEPRLLGTLENIYVFRGEPGHEILFVYTGAVTTDVIPDTGAEFFDLGRPMWVEWRRMDGVGETLPLYPDGVQRLISEAF